MIYLVIKSLHIISVIAWMAGLLYLPRLYVYHAENNENSDISENFKVMEFRLLKYIMNPAMILSVIFGIILFYIIGFSSILTIWGVAKFAGILGLIVVHMKLASHRKQFADDMNHYSPRYFRILNEVPTVLMIVIVFAVVIKPGA